MVSQVNSIFIVDVNGGATYSKIVKEEDEIPGNYNYIFGINAGLGLELKLKSKLSIETNLDFYQNGVNHTYRVAIKSYNYIATKSYFGFTRKITQNYLNNSWTIGYHIGQKIDVKMDVGIYWAVYLGSRKNVKEYRYVDSLDWVEIGDQSLLLEYEETQYSGTIHTGFRPMLDFGLVGKINLGYNFYNKYQTYCFFEYFKGLKDINRDAINVTKNYNSSFCIGLGLKMKL